MAVGAASSAQAVDAARDARERRAECLIRLRTMSEGGRGRDALPTLFADCARDPALLRLHVWRVDQAVYGTADIAAKRRVARAAEWCGSRLERPGSATLSWLLDARTDGARLAAWLLAVALDLGYTLPGPDPYRTHPATSLAAAVPSEHHTSHSNT